MSRAIAGRRRAAGFTLVEVLVALMAMAVLAALSWQGLSMLLAAREANSRALEGTQRLASVVVQWEQDLLALTDTGVVPALQFDGRSLRLTRRGRDDSEGVVLVVFSLQSGRWTRWAAPPQVRVVELQEVWLRSQQLAADDPAQVLLAEGVQGWQLYFHRGEGWSNAQSSGDLVNLPPPPRAALRSTGPAASAPAGGSGSAGAPVVVPSSADDAASAAAAAVEANPSPAAAGPAPAAGATPFTREALPAAVRMVVTLAGDAVLSRDVALAPTTP
jgi:general secretion pathway protein J